MAGQPMKWEIDGAWAAFFVFLGLQLSGAVHWSWWAITGPLWAMAFKFDLERT